MESHPETCLRCGRPTESGFHACPFNVPVFDPARLENFLKRESRTNEEMLVAQGYDVNKFIEVAVEERNNLEQEYLSGDLIYRVEFINVSGLGLQGEMEYLAFIVQGREDSDIERAVYFLNQLDPPLLAMQKGETYLCRLSSFDCSGVRFVWKIKQMIYNGFNKMWVLQN